MQCTRVRSEPRLESSRGSLRHYRPDRRSSSSAGSSGAASRVQHPADGSPGRWDHVAGGVITLGHDVTRVGLRSQDAADGVPEHWAPRVGGGLTLGHVHRVSLEGLVPVHEALFTLRRRSVGLDEDLVYSRSLCGEDPLLAAPPPLPQALPPVHTDLQDHPMEEAIIEENLGPRVPAGGVQDRGAEDAPCPELVAPLLLRRLEHDAAAEQQGQSIPPRAVVDGHPVPAGHDPAPDGLVAEGDPAFLIVPGLTMQQRVKPSLGEPVLQLIREFGEVE
mmetsp:Transcript_83419/g.257901  ORF Transcript_83419/g.257901 Transcript_83419/m.257901 type:complete len:276 (+) Transcript_83419:24-851(+)